ncbi:MAG: hypothetical protein ACXVCY_14960 [Pseudobdellovibrionaceae bacterium]
MDGGITATKGIFSGLPEVLHLSVFPLIEIMTIKKILSQEDRNALREKIEIIGKMLTRLSQIHDIKN